MALRSLLAGSLLRRAASGLSCQAAAASSSLLEALRPAAAAAQHIPQPPSSLASLAHFRHFVTATPAAAPAASSSPAAAAAEQAALAELGEDFLPPPIPIEQQERQGQYCDLVVPVLNLSAVQVGTYVLGGDIFDVPIRRDILHRVVRYQLAKRQQGTHKTKGRSEVRGGGRKPRPQKGSGQSRQGTIRAPQWRGGGIVHGPVPRSHAHSLPKRVRRLGLQCALSAKAWERRLVVVDSLQPGNIKTKDMLTVVDALLVGAPRRSVLLCDSSKTGDDGGEELRRTACNLPWVDTIPQQGLNVYSILQRDYLVLTLAAVKLLSERLRQPIKPCSPTP